MLTASSKALTGQRKITYNSRDYYVEDNEVTEFISKIIGPIKTLKVDQVLKLDYYDEDAQLYKSTTLGKNFVKAVAAKGWNIIYRSFVLEHINVYIVHKENQIASMIVLGKPIPKINETIKSIIKSSEYDLYYSKIITILYVNEAYGNDDYFEGVDLSRRPIQIIEFITSNLPENIRSESVLFWNLYNFVNEFSQFNFEQALPDPTNPLIAVVKKNNFSFYKILVA